jgi:hypothetical protein
MLITDKNPWVYFKLQQLKKNNDKLRIRILTPFDDHIDLVSKRLKDEYDINILNLDESSRIKASFLLVDRKLSLCWIRR